MGTTPNLGLPLMTAASLAKETKYNDAMLLLDTNTSAASTPMANTGIVIADSSNTFHTDPALTFETTPAKALSFGPAGGTVASAADRVKLSVQDTNGVAGQAGLHLMTEGGTAHIFGHIVGLGVTTGLATGSRLHVRGLDGDTGNVVIENYIDATNGPNLTVRHARGTAAVPVRVNANDASGGWRAEAWARDAADTVDGWQTTALITGVVESLDAQGRLASSIWFRNSSGASAAVSSKARITSQGNLCLGTTNAGLSAAFTLMLGPGTAPTTSPTDSVQMYAADRGGVAGKRALHILTEDLTAHTFGDFSGFNTTAPKFTLHVAGRLAFGLTNSAPTDADLANSQGSMYLDAAETNVLIRVRLAGGTYKTATIPLA